MKEEKYIQKQCTMCPKLFWDYSDFRDGVRRTCSRKCYLEALSLKSKDTKKEQERIQKDELITALKAENAELKKKVEELTLDPDPKVITELKEQIQMRQYVIESYRQWFADRTYIMPSYDLPSIAREGNSSLHFDE